MAGANNFLNPYINLTYLPGLPKTINENIIFPLLWWKMIPIITGSPRLQRPFEVLQIQLRNHGLQEKCPSVLSFSHREYLPTQLLFPRQFSDGLRSSEGSNIPRIE